MSNFTVMKKQVLNNHISKLCHSLNFGRTSTHPVSTTKRLHIIFEMVALGSFLMWGPSEWKWHKSFFVFEKAMFSYMWSQVIGLLSFSSNKCALVQVILLGKIPAGRNGNPLQYSCQDNPMDRGAWQVRGVTKNWTQLKWVSSLLKPYPPFFSYPASFYLC